MLSIDSNSPINASIPPEQNVLDNWIWKQNWKSVTDVYNAKSSL